MGMTHVVCINETALDTNKDKPEELKQALGQAIWTLCMDQPFAHFPDGVQRIGSASVLNCGNAVRHVDEVHGADEKVFVWDGGFLKPLDDLSEASLRHAKLLFDNSYKKQMEKIERPAA